MPKFKLDEHFGSRMQKLFRHYGYDTETVNDEGLNGASDKHLFDACQGESRCLVTLDLDFSDIIRFPPYKTHGIIILRPRKRVTIEEIEGLVRQLMEYLKENSPTRQLWIVESSKIRIHKQDAF